MLQICEGISFTQGRIIVRGKIVSRPGIPLLERATLPCHN